jgi:hypothetical protein
VTTRIAKQGFHQSGDRLYERGDTVENLSDETARELEGKGLLYREDEDVPDDVRRAKESRDIRNKQAQPHHTQALPDASSGVQSSANDLGAGGSPMRGETTLGTAHKPRSK